MKGLKYIVAAFAVSAVLVGCSDANNNENNEENVVVAVETALVEKGDFKVSKSSYGHVSLIDQTPVLFDEPAEVEKVHVKNGDKVKKDDVIVTLKTMQGDVEIKAEEEGQIAKLSLRKGDYTSDEDPIALIVDLDKLEAIFNLTKQTRDLLKEDKKVNLTFQDETIKGKVLPFDILPNDSGQYEVKVEFDNEERLLSPGDVVELEIVEERIKDTLFVPTAALVTEDDDSFVYIVDGDLAKKVEVEVIELQSDFVAIEADLDEDDAIIVRGHFSLEDGQEVNVEKEGK